MTKIMIWGISLLIQIFNKILINQYFTTYKNNLLTFLPTELYLKNARLVKTPKSVDVLIKISDKTTVIDVPKAIEQT